MSENNKGVKETMEILEAVKSLAVDTIKASKDGLDIADLSVLVENIGKIKNAVEGAGEVSGELKDLDQAEIGQLISASVAMVFSILDALKH